MFRTSLTTTMLAALLATTAFAQDSAPAVPAETAPAMPAPATPGTPPPASILASGYTLVDKDNLATEIIGRQVYSSTAADAEHIGDVNNLVIGENGQVAAVVIGVGGFLGMGEKNVAVNFSELKWLTAADNTGRYVLATSKDALLAAPDFQTRDAAINANGSVAAPSNTMPANGNAVTPVAPGPAFDRSALTDVTLTADELDGTRAYGPDDEDLGTITDVVLGDDGKTVDAVVIDFGGFLGIGTKPVAIAFDTLKFQQDANGNRYVYLNVTRDQLNAAPAFNAETYKTDPAAQRLSITNG